MPIDPVVYTLRLMHILAAITAVGGMIFIRFALLPAMETLAPDQRRTLHEAVRVRWARVIQISILFLLVSGLINFIMFVGDAKEFSEAWREAYNGTYQMLFGIKFLLALAVFALASILTGRSPGTQKLRDNMRFWLNINLAMALAIVLISGVMRLTHLAPTDPADNPPIAPASSR